MEPEQSQQQLPAVKAIIISTSGLPSHTGIGWKSHLRRKLPPFLLVMCCLAGSREIWGLQEGGDSVEFIRVMSRIQCERGLQANLCFLGCPCGTSLLTRVWGLERIRATARSGGKSKVWQRNGVHFAPSLPNPWSCSSQQLQDIGGGRGWCVPPLSPSTCGFAPVGWVRDISQDSLSPSIAPTARAEPALPVPSSGTGTAGLITPILTGCSMQGIPTASLSASSPGSNSLFKLEPVHPNSLEAE